MFLDNCSFGSQKFSKTLHFTSCFSNVRLFVSVTENIFLRKKDWTYIYLQLFFWNSMKILIVFPDICFSFVHTRHIRPSSHIGRPAHCRFWVLRNCGWLTWHSFSRSHCSSKNTAIALFFCSYTPLVFRITYHTAFLNPPLWPKLPDYFFSSNFVIPSNLSNCLSAVFLL